MDKFIKIEEIDDVYFEQYKLITTNLQSFVKNCNTSKSIMNLISINGHINFLKNAMFDLYETDNIIAMNVLFRSISDYFLRFQYLFLKLIEEKNDNAANEYIQDSYYHDVINQIKSLKFIKEKLNLTFADHIEIPIVKGKMENKYSYKKLIEYIINKINTDKNVKSNSDFLVKMLLSYTKLSKYVHGGIHNLEYTNAQNRQDEMLISVDISCKNAIACFQQIVMVLYQDNKESKMLSEVYYKLDKILKTDITAT